jgi:hypothetical protein
MQGMMTQMLDLASVERKPSGVKEMYAQFDERDEKQQVERRHRMGADLRCNLIETEGPCKHDDHERGNADRRVYPDDYPQCQAPSQTARRYPAA